MGNIATSFFNRARQAPTAPAVTFAGRTLRFGELALRARQLAGALRTDAVRAEGARIVLCMENRPEFLELLLACWTAGLCAVPVNAKLHAKEVAQIAADSDAAMVFASETLADGLSVALAGAAPTSALCVVGSRGYERLAEAAAISCADSASTDLAWIFYTSGTTGRSKGAMLTHRNLMFMAMSYHADIERIQPGDVMLHSAPLSHGSGLYGLPHLLAGGHQIILDGFDADDVLESFVRYRNISMFAASTMVTRLLQAARDEHDVTGLRTLCYGGGPMYVNDLLQALDRFGPRFYQVYGQGESPMTITGLPKDEHIGDGGPAHLARLASCGAPRTGVEVRVVDQTGQALPTGEPGEVITSSDCVMAGYWNNPHASRRALRDGWLWTGDIGQLDERGYLTLRDRSKDLVISGGINIYPREIEEALLLHPAVLECSVVGRPHDGWGEEVVAFVVRRPGLAADEAALDALCLANIARFKRPRAYRFVDSLPKNNYGKVLKTNLREALRRESENA